MNDLDRHIANVIENALVFAVEALEFYAAGVTDDGKRARATLNQLSDIALSISREKETIERTRH